MKIHGMHALQGILEVSKPQLVFFVVLTAVASMYGASMLSLNAPQVEYNAYMHIIIACTMAMAGSGALNHYYDRDIDSNMSRTSTRPIPSGCLSAEVVLVYGVTLSCLSVIYSFLLINGVSAFFIALFIFTYVILYTAWLKRRSAFNIVVVSMVGGASSWAGWAATIGTLDLLGVLVGFLFLSYYPSHYWSMSVLVRDKYERTNVRMLPFVIGMHRTSKYILANTLILVPYSLTLYAFGMGMVYLVLATVTGSLMLFYHYKFTKTPTDDFAWKSLKVTSPCPLIMILAVILDGTFHIRI